MPDRKTDLPDWLPDGQDVDQYPDPEQATAEQWAWEYLRRNSDYQKDYKKAQSQPEELINTTGDLMAVLGQKWGLFVIWDPAMRDLSQIPLFVAQWGPSIIEYVEKDGVCMNAPWVPSSKNEVAVIFDRSKPTEPQIEKARTLLSLARKYPLTGDAAKSYTRISGKKLLECLRVWDARTAGMSYKKIAKWLAPHEPNQYPERSPEKRLSKRFKKAERLINGGYRDLVKPT